MTTEQIKASKREHAVRKFFQALRVARNAPAATRMQMHMTYYCWKLWVAAGRPRASSLNW